MSGEGPWSNQVLNRVVVGGTGSGIGVFVYVGTPGPGNTPVAWMTESTKDPYGNTLPANDIVSYATATTAYAALQSAALLFGKAGLTSPARIGLLSAIPAAGILALTSSQVGGGDTVCTFYLESSNQSGGPFAAVDKIIAWDPTTTPGTTPETWHSLGTLAGYTIVRANYRMNALGNVEFDIDMVAGGANAASVTFSNTLPAAYRPPAARTVPMSSNQASPTALPRLAVSVGGAVTALFMANVTSTFTGAGFMTDE